MRGRDRARDGAPMEPVVWPNVHRARVACAVRARPRRGREPSSGRRRRRPAPSEPTTSERPRPWSHGRGEPVRLVGAPERSYGGSSAAGWRRPHLRCVSVGFRWSAAPRVPSVGRAAPPASCAAVGGKHHPGGDTTRVAAPPGSDTARVARSVARSGDATPTTRRVHRLERPSLVSGRRHGPTRSSSARSSSPSRASSWCPAGVRAGGRRDARGRAAAGRRRVRAAVS